MLVDAGIAPCFLIYSQFRAELTALKHRQCIHHAQRHFAYTILIILIKIKGLISLMGLFEQLTTPIAFGSHISPVE